jgi:hypothetical protein
MGVVGGDSEGELVGRRLAEHDPTGRSHAGDRAGIAGWNVALVHRRSVAGGQLGAVEEVLDGDGQPVERPGRLAAAVARLCRARLDERSLRRDRSEGAERAVDVGDPVKE